MKRTILFKAKDVKTGKWVEGYYAYNMDDDIHIIYTTNDRLPFEVDGNTVCQYSWVKDSRGNKIFDDDIRKDNEGEEFRIIRTFEKKIFRII